MGAASYVEDITDRRIEGLILRQVSAFEENQLASLRAGTLTEDTLQRDLERLRQRIVAPLEAIKEKAGAQGLDLGNQLLKLQSEISAASSSMEQILARIALQSDVKDAGGDVLSHFLESFAAQYRSLLSVLRVTAQPLSADNRKKLDQIRANCEDDVRRVKSLAQRLTARELGIALLYRKVEELQKELDQVRRPGLRDMDATGYDDFGKYIRDKNIKKLQR
jgi:hypothetical protein